MISTSPIILLTLSSNYLVVHLANHLLQHLKATPLHLVLYNSKRNKMSSCETSRSFHCPYRLNVRMSQFKQARTGRNCLKLHFIVVLSVSKEASVVDYKECEASSVRRLYRSTE